MSRGGMAFPRVEGLMVHLRALALGSVSIIRIINLYGNSFKPTDMHGCHLSTSKGTVNVTISALKERLFPVWSGWRNKLFGQC